MNMNTISLCSLAFRDDPLEQLLPTIREAGFDAVEVFGGHVEGKSDAELAVLREQAESLGLEILAVAPYLWLTQNDELREKSMGIAKRTIHQARLLGAAKIRTFTDAGPTGIGSEVAGPEQWDQAVSCLKTITSLAPGICFALEMHANTLADTEASALRVLERVGADNLKLLFQPSQSLWIPEMRRLLPVIGHMHVHNVDSEGKACPLENGRLDMAQFFDALLDAGYQHSLSLEYCWRGPSWEQVRSGKEFLDRNLKKDSPTTP